MGLFILDVETFDVHLKHNAENRVIFIHYIRTKPKFQQVILDQCRQEYMEEGLKKTIAYFEKII